MSDFKQVVRSEGAVQACVVDAAFVGGLLPEQAHGQTADSGEVRDAVAVLKGTRWLLVMNPEKLKQNKKVDERARLPEALKRNESRAPAYDLQEDLRQFWNQRLKPAAEKSLDPWCRRAEASGIRQRPVMAKTLRSHRPGLLNWHDHPISTGPLEGINNTIEARQRQADGDRNDEHLKERLLTLHHTKYTLQG